MKQGFLKADFVEFIPESLKEGVIYISQRYGTATHRCCCGCGQEVVTPIGPTSWSLQIKDGTVTLYPSIGNWSLPCRSHYWIRNGRVEWAGAMTKQDIQRGRVADKRMRDKYFKEANSRKESSQPRTQEQIPQIHTQPDWLDRTWHAIRKWFGS